MMEMKLVLILTLRELEFEFDWAGWNKLQKREGLPDAVDGDSIYRVGNGLGYVKDNLPTRVKSR